MKIEKKVHPSYGKISISRFSSNRAEFFNSDLYHSGGISLEISGASVERRHGSEHVYSEDKLIRIRMSNSQFIDAITSGMNTDGVPCTLERFNGEIIAADNFVQPHQDKFRSDMRGVYDDLEKRIEGLEELLDSPTLGKRKLAEVKDGLDTIKRHMKGNINFTMRTFNEYMEKSVQEAKQSIANYMDHKVNSSGVKAFRDECLIEMPEDNV